MLRAIPLWSERWGLSGRADAVEVRMDDGLVAPVEYKTGSDHGDTAHVQLCAQALCLEEMLGVSIPTGYLWFAARRRREAVIFDDAMRQRTLTAISEVRAVLLAQRLPPAVDDERCPTCQLRDQCQPSLTAHPTSVAAYMHEVLACDC